MTISTAVRHLPVLPKINPVICGACGGKCCKNAPGLTVPEDWESMEAIEVALRSGDWGLRSWWGDPIERLLERHLRRRGHMPAIPVDRVLIPRPGIEGLPESDFATEGRCIMLTNAGCSLSANRKPSQCRELVPDYGACIAPPGHRDHEIALRWRSRAGAMEAIAKRVYG